jgi:hypothetical protein
MSLPSHIKASGKSEKLRLLRNETSEKVRKSLISGERLVVFQNLERGF